MQPYFKQDKKITDENPDYERLILKCLRMNKKVQTGNLTLLIINPNYLVFKVNFRNQEEPATTILYLLNSISFWLDINVIDYPKIIIRVLNEEFRLFKKLYQIFKYKLL